MLYNRFTEPCLFVATLSAGFYAGTGFFVLMGGNPSIKRMTERTFAEYWQLVDHFMAARMKIFGPIMLCCMIAAVLSMIKEYQTPAFWCMLLALALLIADIIFTFSTNHPLNKLVQSWDVNNLPFNAREVKWKIASAFNTRSFFMIASFIMVLLALWLRKPDFL